MKQIFKEKEMHAHLKHFKHETLDGWEIVNCSDGDRNLRLKFGDKTLTITSNGDGGGVSSFNNEVFFLD